MSVAYKLAPENPYPQGPESSAEAALWLYEHATEINGSSDRMAVAGDSAGGYMALYVARIFKHKEIPLKAQFATYPVTDHYSSHQRPGMKTGKIIYLPLKS